VRLTAPLAGAIRRAGRPRPLRASERPRRPRRARLVAPLAVLLAAGAVAGVARGAPGPPPKVFAFVSRLGGAELERLERVGARIDVVAPNWYALDHESGLLRAPLRGDADELLLIARRHGVSVWPTVNALTGGSAAWTAPAARTRIVASLRAAALGPGVSGVTLDMEELRPSQRRAFSALVREAAASLHAVDRKLAVYVPRQDAAYDWEAIAGRADLLLASGYNEHWASSRPGPVTTANGFAAVTERALERAGAKKAVPVLGAFGYRWPARGRGTLISSADALALRRGQGTAVTRADGAERFRAGADTIVYETAAGLRARAKAARAAGARWIGLFSLGREPAHFWDAVETDRMVSEAKAG
jgi:spore germination protein YaaH